MPVNLGRVEDAARSCRSKDRYDTGWYARSTHGHKGGSYAVITLEGVICCDNGAAILIHCAKGPGGRLPTQRVGWAYTLHSEAKVSEVLGQLLPLLSARHHH